MKKLTGTEVFDVEPFGKPRVRKALKKMSADEILTVANDRSCSRELRDSLYSYQHQRRLQQPALEDNRPAPPWPDHGPGAA